MAETMTFPTEDVLSCSTGRLLGDIGGIYKIAQFFTGGPVWTHQLVRLGPLMKAEIKSQHPDLPDEAAAADVTAENWQDFRDQWTAQFGPEIKLTKPEGVEFSPRDPIGELDGMLSASKENANG